MITEIVIALTGLFCTAVSSILTFILTKRRYNTEVDSQQIQNVNESFGAYKRMMEDTLELQNKKIESLEKENENLKQQIENLRNQVFELMKSKIDEISCPSPKRRKPRA